jgi:hypothetical protein
MSSVLVHSPMAKRKARTGTVRIDEELIRMANVISAIRDVTVPDYLNELLRPTIERDYHAELQKESRKTGGKGGAK